MNKKNNLENTEYEIKIYQIDKTFYEFKENSLNNNGEIINYIINQHRKKVKDIENLNNITTPVLIDGVDYYTYVYNEEPKDVFWKNYIPESLSNNLVFQVQQLSFTMFASIEENIYVIVGGGGSRVIIRFQNHRFGLDFFEYITDLDEDVISLETRGISGKLTKRKDIFKDGLKLVDILNFTNIPSKINIILKQEIKDSVFDFIPFDNRITTIEIGSYFNIKFKIPFTSLHLLFKKINEITKTNIKQSLSSFVEVKDKGIISNVYRENLLHLIYDNMIELNSAARGQVPKKLDIEFVHPSKIQEFYEAEHYIFKFKGARNGFLFKNKKNLYYDGLKLVYDNLININYFEFKKIISGLHLYGIRKNENISHAMFLDHIVCEISIENKPIFQIDAKWFKVEDNFTKTINEICSRMINNNYLSSGIITKKWYDKETEDDYNRKYHLQENYWVLDKAIGQNIELCDIMYEDDTTIYFIHVKNGFDAKIRDLSNQIQISANRFMNERNSGKEDFITSVIDAYNNKPVNFNKPIDKVSFKEKFKTGSKNIQFVMAFKSDLKRIQNIKGNLDKIQSNIAKYSLIQCVREMNTMSFPIKIFEIEKK